MDRHIALRVAWRLALLGLAGLLITGSLLSLVFTDCAWQRGGICGGDIDLFLEGYVTGTALMAGAAALVALTITRRWAWLVAAALGGIAVAVSLAMYFEGML